MAIVLYAWELGGGLGHLANLLPLARGLSARGHRVVAALRDLSRRHQVFSGVPLALVQAPFKIRPADGRGSQPRTFAHVVGDHGFGDAGELRTMVGAWRAIYDAVRPDLIVFDHSPTALLAARDYSARRALIGTGFSCPSAGYPLANLRPWMPDDSARLRDDEDRVLANANRVLADFGLGRLERISQLYEEVDENFLTTFAELDPYPGRKDGKYWGPMLLGGGKTPVWPDGPGKRVYAYLKPFAALPRLLEALDQLQCPTIVYGNELDGRLRARFRRPTLRFEDAMLDMRQVAQQCDVAVLNGTHASAAAMLLAGKPSLQLPIYLEQAINGLAVALLGAGVCLPVDKPEGFAPALESLLNSPSYTEAAARFAARHADFDAEQQVAGILTRVDGLLQLVA